MKKSDLKLLQSNMQKALKPPPKKRDDLSDELSKLFDDGTVLQSEKGIAPADDVAVDNTGEAPRLTSTQPSSAHLSSPQTNQVKTGSSSKRKKTPVAADRDFNRRPNSIERDALPAGLFPGTSKKLYDALFLRTRGAHNPKRTIQATRTELMRWAGIGSRNTFLSHMRHLTKIGLLIRRFEVGNNEGAEYEVCIPEEIDLSSLTPSAQLTSAQVSSPQPGSAQNLDVGSAQKVGRAEVSQTVDSIEDQSRPNTSFKTNTIDDDKAVALSDLIEILSDANFKLTGRVPQAADRQRWAELARVLVDELNKAAAFAARPISSVPAFLSAHLKGHFAQKFTTLKSAGKPEAKQSRAPAEAAEDNRRLTPEEISEQASVIAELLRSDYTIEQAEAQFAIGLNPDDWTAIRNATKAQIEEKGSVAASVREENSQS